MREKMVAVPSQRANQRLDQDCALMYKCSISQLAVTIYFSLCTLELTTMNNSLCFRLPDCLI